LLHALKANASGHVRATVRIVLFLRKPPENTLLSEGRTMINLIVVDRFLNLLTGGIYTGFLVEASVIELTLRSFDASVYTQVQYVKHTRLHVLAKATLLPELVSGLALLVLNPLHGTVFALTLVALLCLAGALVVTLRVNVAINDDQMTWNVQAPPSNWAAVRDRWQVAHFVRTSLKVIAFCCQIIAALRAI
jgi:uncharacterized membrane protein